MDKRIVVKHNAAIKATYNLTLTEMHMMYMCISQIKRVSETKNPRQFRVRHDAFCKEFGIKSSVYENMKQAARTLQKRVITINERVVINGVQYDGGSINVLSSQFWQEDEGEILLEFSEHFMPYLERMKCNFTHFLMNDIAKMKSIYAMRFYELLKMSYEQQKTNKETPRVLIEVAEIRRMFELDDKYKKYGDFRKRVIEIAVQEINEYSPLKISYEQIKKGRRIHAIKFLISKKATSLELKNTKNKRVIEKAITELKEAFAQKRAITLLGKKVIDINGSIISFNNNTSSNIYAALVESDAKFTVG